MSNEFKTMDLNVGAEEKGILGKVGSVIRNAVKPGVYGDAETVARLNKMSAARKANVPSEEVSVVAARSGLPNFRHLGKGIDNDEDGIGDFLNKGFE